MYTCIESPYGGADPNELAALEAARGIKLPEDYKSFLLECGGGSLIENSIDAIARDEGHFEIRTLYGIDPESGVLFSDLDGMQDCYEGAVTDDLFVIGRDHGGNLIAILLASPHTVIWWDHETGERVKLADSFTDLLARIRPTPSSPPECDFSNWESLPADWRSEYRRTVCECAAMEGRSDVVERWAYLGRPFGESMRFAAMNGNLNVVDVLISLGNDINQICYDGRTPLDWAFFREERVSALRERGALLAAEQTN